MTWVIVFVQLSAFSGFLVLLWRGSRPRPSNLAQRGSKRSTSSNEFDMEEPRHPPPRSTRLQSPDKQEAHPPATKPQATEEGKRQRDTEREKRPEAQWQTEAQGQTEERDTQTHTHTHRHRGTDQDREIFTDTDAERKRQRRTQTHTDRHTDTDTHTQKQRDNIETQRERQHRETHPDRDTPRHTHTHRQRHACRGHIYTHTETHTHTPTHPPTHPHGDTHTHTLTHTRLQRNTRAQEKNKITVTRTHTQNPETSSNPYTNGPLFAVAVALQPPIVKHGLATLAKGNYFLGFFFLFWITFFSVYIIIDEITTSLWFPHLKYLVRFYCLGGFCWLSSFMVIVGCNCVPLF